MFSLILLFRLRKGYGLNKEIQTLQILFLINIILLSTDIFWALIEENLLHPPVLINAAINASADMSVACGCYFWYCFTGERLHYPFYESKTARRLIRIPVLVLCILDITSIFTGSFFYIDKSNHYHITSSYMFQIYVNCFYLTIPAVFSISQMIRMRCRQKMIEYFSYVLFFAGAVACIFLEDMFPTVPLLSLTVFTAMLILFLIIYVNREREIMKKQRDLLESRATILQKEQELAQFRTAIMLSQIQPHFLYNTLTAIQTMCHGKAPEAEKSINQFAQFLRGNLDSLSQMNPIPFRQELAHTKNYLGLETKRFGEDILHIEYRIEETDFRIPALSLQPMVENAVRYGVMQREKGGSILISSYATEDSFIVTVKDDGVGFDISAKKLDERSHIGIANVRSRLKEMCHGTLIITSVPGKGTTAVITIPKS